MLGGRDGSIPLAESRKALAAVVLGRIGLFVRCFLEPGDGRVDRLGDLVSFNRLLFCIRGGWRVRRSGNGGGGCAFRRVLHRKTLPGMYPRSVLSLMFFSCVESHVFMLYRNAEPDYLFHCVAHCVAKKTVAF